jgi:hypothetical protein
MWLPNAETGGLLEHACIDSDMTIEKKKRKEPRCGRHLYAVILPMLLTSTTWGFHDCRRMNHHDLEVQVDSACLPYSAGSSFREADGRTKALTNQRPNSRGQWHLSHLGLASQRTNCTQFDFYDFAGQTHPHQNVRDAPGASNFLLLSSTSLHHFAVTYTFES